MVVFFIVTESSLKFNKTKLKKKKSFQINKRKFCSGQTLYGLITEDALCIVWVRVCPRVLSVFHLLYGLFGIFNSHVGYNKILQSSYPCCPFLEIPGFQPGTQL